MAFTEDDLADVLRFLRREPPHAWIGGSLTTYPGGDQDARALYERCEELERRGMAKRREGEGYVIFEAVEV